MDEYNKMRREGAEFRVQDSQNLLTGVLCDPVLPRGVLVLLYRNTRNNENTRCLLNRSNVETFSCFVVKRGFTHHGILLGRLDAVVEWRQTCSG